MHSFEGLLHRRHAEYLNTRGAIFQDGSRGQSVVFGVDHLLTAIVRLCLRRKQRQSGRYVIAGNHVCIVFRSSASAMLGPTEATAWRTTALSSEWGRGGEEDENLGAQVDVLEQVADGPGDDGWRPVPHRVLNESGHLEIGDKEEGLVGELRKEKDCVQDAENDETRVQLMGCGRVDVTRLPRVVDLSNLVTAFDSLRQQHHTAREDDEERTNISNHKIYDHHEHTSGVKSTSGLAWIDGLDDPVGAYDGWRRSGTVVVVCRCLDVWERGDEAVGPEAERIDETEWDEEDDGDQSGSSKAADLHESLRTLVDENGLRCHGNQKPWIKM